MEGKKDLKGDRSHTLIGRLYLVLRYILGTWVVF